MPNISICLTTEQVQQLVNGQDIIISISSVKQCDAASSSPSAASPVNTEPSPSFFQFFKEQIHRLERNGSLRTTETYRAAYRKFSTFCGRQELTFDAINADMLEDFQSSLRHQNLSLNTISFYMRILRSVYRKGVEQGITSDSHPFAHVYTGHAKTDKRAISIEDMRKIKELEIDDRQVRFARDLFLFSFYTRGMSFVDIAYLQQCNIQDGVLSYKRRKTGQKLSMRWEATMQEIVDLYQGSQPTPYLLPIIKKQNGKERNQYRHIQTLVNRHLRTVAQMAGLPNKLTMYCARHSWASIARQLQIPLEVISHGMGHFNERTTEIYLKSVDNQIIDQANIRIMNLLK
mgnify:FL=1